MIRLSAKGQTISKANYGVLNSPIKQTILIISQGVSCDCFLGRTHKPRTSRFRCARTRVRTSNLKWSHFAPALALLVN